MMGVTALKPEMVDEVFHSLPPEGRMEILNVGIPFYRLNLEKRLERAQDKVLAFEARYRTTLRQLEADGLPDDADYAMHEDYVEWRYWSRELAGAQDTLHALSLFPVASEPV